MAKAALHFGKSSTFGSAEGRENQRRWTKEDYDRHNKYERFWYDITRAHLNFEVDSNFKPRPCGTSDPIEKRFEKRLEELGEKPLDKNTKNPPNRVIKFIVSGDQEVLRQLAFGRQDVDYRKSPDTDNSHIRRQYAIEAFSQRVRLFFAEKYGNENIIGFDVHLDEGTPHIHIAVVPIVMKEDKKTGEKKPVLSYKGVMGNNKHEGAEIMKQLHTDFYLKVGKEYGLERGESVEGREVHHISKPEYYRLLNKEIKQLEIAKKSLTTQMNNLLEQRAQLLTEIEEIERLLNINPYDPDLSKRLDRAKNALEILEHKISDKEAKFDAASEKLDGIMKTSRELLEKTQEFAESFNQDDDPMRFLALTTVAMGAFKAVMENFQREEHYALSCGEDYRPYYKLLPHELEYNEDQLFDLSLIFLIGGDPRQLVTGGGGGGSSDNDLRWDGRRRDEDMIDYSKRCFQHALKLHKAGYRSKLSFSRGFRR